MVVSVNEMVDALEVELQSYGVRRCNYFRGEPLKNEVQIRVVMFKNGKATGKGGELGLEAM